ncbi:hypothetical protein [Zunongwangia sp.]|uniref:hypothetical protein n=1 Tax=Zunongwangia sp. TaxID=1965325 RepID=UPI003AA81564
MENSIEKIWEKGNHGSIMKPDFYNRKTSIVYQKINEVMKKDQLLLIPVSIGIISLLLFYKKYDAAIATTIFLGLHYIFNHLIINKLSRLEIGQKSYSFLIEYQKLLKSTVKKYALYMGTVFSGGLSFVFYCVYKETEVFTKIIQNQNLSKILVLVGFIYIILTIISVSFYLLNTKILYWKLLKKIDVLLKEYNESESQL